MNRINSNQYNINFSGVNTPTEKITKGIFFAGGGGWSQGVKELKDIEVRWILNHDRTALRTSSFHNKGVKVFWSDVYMQDEKEMEPVEMVQASLECDEHTGANTAEEKEVGSYTMGWELYRYLPHLNPFVISIENVPAFKNWAPLDENNKPVKAKKGEEFERWKKAVMDLGYEYKESIRNAADDGLPTRRVRFFCFFHRPGINITFPESTHAENGKHGKKKWIACREFINTEDTGISIFGRQFNEALPKQHRKPLCKNSIRRIAGGIKKQYPEFYQFLAKYYNSSNNPESQTQNLSQPLSAVMGIGKHQLVTLQNAQFLAKYHAGAHVERSQSLEKPINTIDTSNRHQLVTLEKLRFIMDHCHSDKIQDLTTPLGVQTTRQTKQLINIESDDFFITQYYGGSIQSNNLEQPINTITSRDAHQLIRVEKMQFITTYFNSNGHPERNTQSLNEPLSPVMSEPKHQLITLLDNFDIKARFLRADELAACSTFPRNYFSHPELKLSQKAAIELIGNAVPPKWAKVLLEPNMNSIKRYKAVKLSA